jgi:hypothetical protein
MNRRIAVLSILVAGCLLIATSAPAALVANLSSWQIDLSKLSGGEALAAGTIVKGIDEVFYTGFAHNTLYDVAPGGTAGIIDIGDHARIQGILRTTDLGSDSGPIDSKGLKSAWDLTFSFDVEIVYTGFTVLPGGQLVAGFTHLGAGDLGMISGASGLLNFYIDTNANGITLAASGTPAANWTDGDLVASLSVCGGDTGTFNLTALDGQDDGTFFDSVPSSFDSDVFLNSAGTSFDALPLGEVVFAITDSNFDADPKNTGALGTVPGLPSGFGASAPANTLADFNAKEDGSARFGVTPEPATVVVWGLLGVCAIGLVRFSKKK